MCCLLFCGVVIELWLFSVGIFCCDSGAILEGGGWEQRVMGKGCGNCVTRRFLKDSLIQFSIID